MTRLRDGARAAARSHPLPQPAGAARRRRRSAWRRPSAAPLIEPVQFFRSYLVAYLFFTGIALGSLGLVSLNHVTGGRWGVVIRRVCEAAMRTLPLLLVLFLPLLFGLGQLYEWARPEDVAHDPLLQQQAALSQRAVLHRARRDLLRRLADRDRAISCAGRASRTTTGDPRPGAPPAVPRPRRAAALRPDHDVRGGRLGDVARAALVLDHLRHPDHRRPGAERVRVRHSGARC